MKCLSLLFVVITLLGSFQQSKRFALCSLAPKREFKQSGLYIVSYRKIKDAVKVGNSTEYPIDGKKSVYFLPLEKNPQMSITALYKAIAERNLRSVYVSYEDFNVLGFIKEGPVYLKDTTWQKIQETLSKTDFIEYRGDMYQVLFVESCWIRIDLERKRRALVEEFFDSNIPEAEYSSLELFFPTKLLSVSRADIVAEENKRK